MNKSAAFAESLLLEANRLKSHRGRVPLAELKRYLQDFRALEHHVAALDPRHAVRMALESVYLQVQEQIARPAHRYQFELQDFFARALPTSFFALRKELAISITLFVGFALLGYWMVHRAEELAALFMAPEQMEQVRDGKVWTDALFTMFPGSVLSVQIMLNNILVCLFAFAIGAFYGLGTLYVLASNGLMLGSMLAFTYAHGVGERLLYFIPAHGMAELFIICLSSACGLHIGDALANPGALGRLQAFQVAVARVTPLLLAGVAGLVVCGVIEGYISPNPAFSFSMRIAIGAIWLLCFVLLLSGALGRLFFRKR